jgi:hypothetical protein
LGPKEERLVDLPSALTWQTTQEKKIELVYFNVFKKSVSFENVFF